MALCMLCSVAVVLFLLFLDVFASLQSPSAPAPSVRGCGALGLAHGADQLARNTVNRALQHPHPPALADAHAFQFRRSFRRRAFAGQIRQGTRSQTGNRTVGQKPGAGGGNNVEALRPPSSCTSGHRTPLCFSIIATAIVRPLKPSAWQPSTISNPRSRQDPLCHSTNKQTNLIVHTTLIPSPPFPHLHHRRNAP
jgi:hypothetical protein